MPYTPKSGDVLITLANGRRRDGTRSIALQIEDEAAGRFVIDVTLTGEQLASILGNAATRVSGARMGEEIY